MMNLHFMIYDGFNFERLLVVEDVDRPSMADISANVDDGEGIDGGYDNLSRFKPKELTVSCRLIRPYERDYGLDQGFEKARRELASRLFRRSFAPLVLYDAPDIYEMAKLDSKTNFKKFVYTRTLELNFICEPFSYGARRTKDAPFGGSLQVLVDGNAPTAPVVTVQADGAFSFLFDDEVFDVLADVHGEVVIDTCRHTVTHQGVPIEYSAYSRHPVWEPGNHVVGCLHPFEIRWDERWL